MIDDRLLVAVNNLVEWYESQVTKKISIDTESNLDILQISNLHKIDMFMHGFEMGNNLQFTKTVKEVLSASESQPKEQYNEFVKSDYEECVSEIDPTSITENIKDSDLALTNQKLNESDFGKKYKKYYNKTDNLGREKYNDFFEDLFPESEKNSISNKIIDCIDCRKPFIPEQPFPAFELGWEMKQFLKNLNLVLEDIRQSLDPTKNIGEICNFISLLRKKWLCLSSWPLIAASFPIIVTRIRFQLLELGFSWTGLIGGLLSPVISSVTHMVEMLRNMTVPIFDCITNAFRSIIRTIESIDAIIDSTINQSMDVAGTFKSFFSSAKEQVEKSNKAKEELNKIEEENKYIPSSTEEAAVVKGNNQAPAKKTKTPLNVEEVNTIGNYFFVNPDPLLSYQEVKKYQQVKKNETISKPSLWEDYEDNRFSSEPPSLFNSPTATSPETTDKYFPDPEMPVIADKKKKPKKSEGLLGGRIHNSQINSKIEVPAYKTEAFLKSRISRSPFKKNKTLEPVLKAFKQMEKVLRDGLKKVTDLFNKIIYTLKAFSRLIIEPIYLSTKLITEIKITLNLVKLFGLIYRLYQLKIDDFCSKEKGSDSFKAFEQVFGEQFPNLEIVYDQEEDDRSLALIKSKDSNYQTRMQPDDCGEILIKVNDNQRDIDLIYDKISTILG